MASLNISLPEPLRDFVEKQAEEGGYMSSSEYIRELIRAAKRRLAHEHQLEQLLLEGIESGRPQVADRAYWKNKEDQLAERWADLESA